MGSKRRIFFQSHIVVNASFQGKIRWQVNWWFIHRVDISWLFWVFYKYDWLCIISYTQNSDHKLIIIRLIWDVLTCVARSDDCLQQKVKSGPKRARTSVTWNIICVQMYICNCTVLFSSTLFMLGRKNSLK